MTTENSGISRRTLVKGAAWSMPVIAVAAATPLAAASTTNADIAWTSTDSGLLNLRVLDSTEVIGATAVVTVPDQYTITNGPGAISDNATVYIRVDRPSGINLSAGRARGFGVYSVDGIATTAGERSVDYDDLIGLEFGFPITEWTGTRSVTIASDGTLQVPVEFGLAGETDLLAASLVPTFPVTLTVTFSDSSSYTATSTISALAGAGIL